MIKKIIGTTIRLLIIKPILLLIRLIKLIIIKIIVTIISFGVIGLIIWHLLKL